MSDRIDELLHDRRIQDVTSARPGAVDVREVVRAVASARVPEVTPDTFRLDEGNPLARLTGHPPQVLQRFSQFQDRLSQRIGQLPSAEIARTLEDLYSQAYEYNETTHEMTPAHDPESQEAKRELDLWIACLDRQSYRDESVTHRLWAEPRIRVIMALNSPRLTPRDRGAFYQLDRADRLDHANHTDGVNFRNALRQLNGEYFDRTFHWMRNRYAGNNPPWDDPDRQSQYDCFAAVTARFGADRVAQVSSDRRIFPTEQVNALLAQYGLRESYEGLRHLSPTVLLARYMDLNEALGNRPAPEVARRMVEEQTLVEAALCEQGVDTRREGREFSINSAMSFGVSRQDAEHLYDLGNFRKTGFHLDDYRARFDFLNQYRELYRNLFVQPIRQSFSPESTRRYNMWGQALLNRAQMRIPIHLEDLDRVRTEVLREGRVQEALVATPGVRDFRWRDLRTSFWVTPTELGACGNGFSGPLDVAGLITFQGINVNDLICRNTEFFLFLPRNLYPVDHSLGAAFGVFGIAIIRNDNIDGSDPWISQGEFVQVAAHESSHIGWHRRFFDDDSSQLPQLLPNEIQAEGVTVLTIRGYLGLNLNNGSESGKLRHTSEYFHDCIFAGNDFLGLPHANMDLGAYDRHWGTTPMAFLPSSLVGGNRAQRIYDQSMLQIPPNDELDRRWRGTVLNAFSRHLETSAERNQAWNALNSLRDPHGSPGEYFLRSHPLTRVVNILRAEVGLPPVNYLGLPSTGGPSLREWWLSFGREAVVRSFHIQQLRLAQRQTAQQ